MKQMKGNRKTVGDLTAVTKNRNGRLEGKKTLHDSMTIPALIYGNETWTSPEG